MASIVSDGPQYLPMGTRSVKIVILGAFGVGKTTLVQTISEIAPLQTEERLTQAGQSVDDLPVAGKTTTTVAMDFGRRTLGDGSIVVYMFGAPGQDRFAQTVRLILEGALGALVMVDTRHIEQSWDSIGLLEEASVPYVIAVNQFSDAPPYSEAILRDALSLPRDRPLVYIDARHIHSVKAALVALVTDILRPMGNFTR
ncbi:ATP/GTP-binding protein [Streptomyces sp. NPDC056549]|uniref:GTP-binding protein n=1 Tax=Streptomyces sp. NPDC056549 TaxID=3345864 RepID=UPI0036C805AF